MATVKALVLLVVAGAYVPLFAVLARLWREHPYGGHGMFVPALSALLLYWNWPRFRARIAAGSVTGLVLIGLGLALLAVGRGRGSLLVEGLSVPLTLAGAVLWTLGSHCLRVAAFPIAFLVLMLPLPRAIVDTLTLDLQLVAARSAGAALRLLDIPFYQEGLVIHLRSIALKVEEVCNGLRFLTALLTLTIAFAYVTQRTFVRRAVLVASAVPIAIVANALRVALIAAAVHYLGPHAASGTIHNWIGKTVWAGTLIPLIVIGLVLRLSGDGAPGVARPAPGAPTQPAREGIPLAAGVSPGPEEGAPAVREFRPDEMV